VEHASITTLHRPQYPCNLYYPTLSNCNSQCHPPPTGTGTGTGNTREGSASTEAYPWAHLLDGCWMAASLPSGTCLFELSLARETPLSASLQMLLPLAASLSMSASPTTHESSPSTLPGPPCATLVQATYPQKASAPAPGFGAPSLAPR
jgi:hypothetical protein